MFNSLIQTGEYVYLNIEKALMNDIFQTRRSRLLHCYPCIGSTFNKII